MQNFFGIASFYVILDHASMEATLHDIIITFTNWRRNYEMLGVKPNASTTHRVTIILNQILMRWDWIHHSPHISLMFVAAYDDKQLKSISSKYPPFFNNVISNIRKALWQKPEITIMNYIFHTYYFHALLTSNRGTLTFTRRENVSSPSPPHTVVCVL